MANVVRLGKELVVVAPVDKAGVLASVTSLLLGKKVNITAVNAAAISGLAVIQMVTNNNAQAKAILKAKKYDVSEREVVLVELEDKPGTLRDLTKKIADKKINLSFLYGSAGTGSSSMAVLSSCDNRRAAALLK